jgi:hypothetical protein
VPHATPVVVHKNIGVMAREYRIDAERRGPILPAKSPPVSRRGAVLRGSAGMSERGTTGTVNRQHPLIRAGEGRWQGRREPGQAHQTGRRPAQYPAESVAWTGSLMDAHRTGVPGNRAGPATSDCEDPRRRRGEDAARSASRMTFGLSSRALLSAIFLSSAASSSAPAFQHCTDARTSPQFGKISDAAGRPVIHTSRWSPETARVSLG